MSLLQKIARRTLRLVRGGIRHTSPDFSILLDLVSSVTESELQFSVGTALQSWEDGRHAERTPCLYSDIHEDDAMSMGVFMLRDNQQIPLHDHPEMHGIIKVIYGRLRVTCYSVVRDIKLFEARSEVAKLCQYKLFAGDEEFLVPVKFEHSTVITPSDKAVFLTPLERNLHRILAIDGDAAFFDLLMPPYLDPVRSCHYFMPVPLTEGDVPKSTLPKAAADHDWVLQIAPPSSYYCDVVRFTGTRPIIKE